MSGEGRRTAGDAFDQALDEPPGPPSWDSRGGRYPAPSAADADADANGNIEARLDPTDAPTRSIFDGQPAAHWSRCCGWAA